MRANWITHQIIVLDASGSMIRHTSSVIKVTDSLISYLASSAGNFPEQETRITVYAFSTDLPGGCKCLIWDKDVLRVPSISGLYRAGGGTPLCEAVTAVIRDVREIPVKYGDHSVLGYVVTDAGEGGEHSQEHVRRALPGLIRSLPDTWTLAGLVPGVWSKQQLITYGFAPGNIEIWDPSRREGVEEMGERIRVSSDAYATAYASAGPSAVRSVKSLFTMASPSASDLKRTLTPLTPGSYYFEEVTADDLAKIERGRLDQFMKLKTGKPYMPGDPVTFYQMDRRVRIQKNKRIAVAIPDHQGKTVDVYSGSGARSKLGLPEDADVRVTPARWPDYRVFVESTSFNRRLYPGTSVLVMR